MTFESFHVGFDDPACRYSGCRIDFRGPQVDILRPFIACLGSSEVHGRFVRECFAGMVGDALNLPVANLGVQNAGLDVFTREEALQSIAERADIVILQAMGAPNMSNRFYSVHPRRNDRFLRESSAMRHTFRGVDFSDFVFTRHMLSALQRTRPSGYGQLVTELSTAWVARMNEMVQGIPGKVILLWIENTREAELGGEPLLVTPEMIDAVRPNVDKVIHCDVTGLMHDDQLEEMSFPSERIESARLALPPAAHEQVATKLVRAIVPMLPETNLKGHRKPPRQLFA